MTVSATGTGTTLTVSLDGSVIWQGDPGECRSEISHDFDDIDGAQHLLSIEMLGKTPGHTQINDAGEIVKDLLIEVCDFSFDDINIDQLVWDQSEYHHDFNGTQSAVIDKFYGSMGCNGKVQLEFTGPIYLWLLESM